LRFFVGALVLAIAIFHLVLGVSLASNETVASTIDIVFGIIYIILCVGLFVRKRPSIYLCLIFCFIDGIGGTFAHIASHAVAPLIAAAIYVVIILGCCCLLPTKPQSTRALN